MSNLIISKKHRVSLTKFHLQKNCQQRLLSSKIPDSVQKRIDYFAKYISKGLTFSDLYLLVAAEPNEDELREMFEDFFCDAYLEVSCEFLEWYRNPTYWKQRQVELAFAVIQAYQQKITKEKIVV